MKKAEDIRLGNAAGMVKTMNDVAKLCKSKVVSRCMIGTITKEPREGNRGHRYEYDEPSLTALNAIGLENPGMAEYRRLLPEMVRMLHDHDIEAHVSVAGVKRGEFPELVEQCLEAGVDGTELNFGCGNVKDDGKTHAIISYDLDLAEEILMSLRPVVGNVRVGVKISPVPDELLLPLANVVTRSGIIGNVSAVNTRPNIRKQKADGTEWLAYYPPGSNEVRHEGGESGAPLREHGLRVVEAMRKNLLPDVEITGIGGVFTGTDAYRYFLAGANRVAVGTAYYEYGPSVLTDIMFGLVDIVTETA